MVHPQAALPRPHVYGGDKEARKLLQHKDKIEVRGIVM